MKKIAFSGTLDPITNGHMWVIQEARALADEVIVMISENPFKKPQFSASERKAIVEKSIMAQGWTNVSVVLVKNDYTARTAKRLGIDYLIRGIRNTADFDYENLIQQANVEVLQGAKTIFVMPPRDLGSVSSSFVRALQGPVGWHWNVEKFLPEPAYKAWIVDWLGHEWRSLWIQSDVDTAVRANEDKWFQHLSGGSAYGSPQRHYHNLNHLVHGLTEIAAWAATTNANRHDVDTIKKAFWFHDVVYDDVKQGISNEEASARLWLESGLDIDNAAEVADLIRATDHLQQNDIAHPLKDIMIGVDLAILGQSNEVYDQYARDVRKEYRSIEEKTYRTNRKNVMMYFQNKASSGELFNDAYFNDLYNQQALVNFKREIESLS
jgi:pantetheine-phosphate adenylyltransferase